MRNFMSSYNKAGLIFEIGLGVALLGGMSVYAYTEIQAEQSQETTLIEMQSPSSPLQTSQAKTILAEVENLKAAGKFEECIVQAKTALSNSNYYADANALTQECRFEWANQLAASNNYKEALVKVGRISPSSEWHTKAQPLITEWAKRLNLSGDWWLCSALGNSEVTNKPSQVEFYKNSNTCYDPALECYCQKIN